MTNIKMYNMMRNVENPTPGMNWEKDKFVNIWVKFYKVYPPLHT